VDDLKISLKWWVAGKHPKSLISFIEKWFYQVRTWLQFIEVQDDPQTCAIEILDLMAWERRINKLSNEPIWLYRNRVDFAFLNNIDAGSAAGFKRIFERLGLGFVQVKERPEGRDWDVVVLEMTDGELSNNIDLLNEVVDLYGRTCRQYEFTVTTNTNITISAGEFSSSHETYQAEFII
jgi:hypothetical protein